MGDQTMKKIIVLLLAIVIIAWYFIPVSVDKEVALAKVQYGNKEVASEVYIQFKGYKHRRLIKPSYFEGVVQVGETQIEMAYFNLDVMDSFGGVLDDSEDVRSYASIYVSHSFDAVSLFIYENQQWAMETGIILTGPVTSREEAVDQINEHLQTNPVFKDVVFK
jgi:hypothetical protein